MAMSFTSKDQAVEAAKPRSSRTSQTSDLEAILMGVTIVTVFAFVGSITFGLL